MRLSFEKVFAPPKMGKYPSTDQGGLAFTHSWGASIFLQFHNMLLVTSTRISQAPTVCTIRYTSKFQLRKPPIVIF